MKKKLEHIIFIGLFLAILLIPTSQFNFTDHIESKIENRVMTKWPGFGFNQEKNAWYVHYVEDRVGFRESAIRLYNNTIHSIFHEFSEDMHMYGKNSYVFPADSEYIKAYQNLNTDQELCDRFVRYLSNSSEYLKQKGIPFIFMVGLDKKSVYPQYFPDSIHQNKNMVSIMDYMSKQLTNKGVPFVIPVDEFRAKSKAVQIYNEKTDCAHWNDLGAFYGVQLLDEEIKKHDIPIRIISDTDFVVSYEQKDVLDFAQVKMDPEKIPVLSTDLSNVYLDTELMSKIEVIPGTNIQCYRNLKAQTDLSILLFHDSFFEQRERFFVNRFQNVYMVSRQNYENLQYFVNLLEPDVVVYENAERSFVDDLYAYTNLDKVKYQSPFVYESQSHFEEEFHTSQALALDSMDIQGASGFEHKIQDLKEPVITIRTSISKEDLEKKGLNVFQMECYALVGDDFKEMSYRWLKTGNEGELGVYTGYFVREQITNQKIFIFAIDKESNTMYQLEEFEVMNE